MWGSFYSLGGATAVLIRIRLCTLLAQVIPKARATHSGHTLMSSSSSALKPFHPSLIESTSLCTNEGDGSSRMPASRTW